MGQELSTDGAAVADANMGEAQDSVPWQNGIPESEPRPALDVTERRERSEIEPRRTANQENPESIKHDTGVSQELLDLLATLNDPDSGDEAPKESVPAAKISLSATAREFVPGRAFGAEASRVPSSDVNEASSQSGKPGGSPGGFNAEAPEFVPSWQTSGTGAQTTTTQSFETPGATYKTVLPTSMGGAGGLAGLGRNVRVIDKKCWWYRDPGGVVRGAFSTTDMRAWADKGYFSGGLEIALSDRGPFLPLSAVYPPPERAFWKSVEPREFAMRMKQHMTAVRAMAMSGAAGAVLPGAPITPPGF